MLKPCDKNIKWTIELSHKMIRLADQGDKDREDTGCGVLYGVLRDSAYKILQLAEREKARHQAKGWWQEECNEIDDHCSPQAPHPTNHGR